MKRMYLKRMYLMLGSLAAVGLMAASSAAYAAPPAMSGSMSMYSDKIDIGVLTINPDFIAGDLQAAPVMGVDPGLMWSIHNIDMIDIGRPVAAASYLCDPVIGDPGGGMLQGFQGHVIDTGGGHLSMAMLGDTCSGSGLDPSKALVVGQQAPA